MVEASLGNRDNGLPMVTLAERISEPDPRRSRRLPGSPCTLATQDATAVKSLHRDNFTRSYPQGSTAIPACEANYPGAAALTRHPASTGFRGGDATSSLGLSPNALNINGANTYQFVMSNPVGSVDVAGLDTYTEHGSISFNPTSAGVILAPDRTVTMTYTLKLQYYDAGGAPAVGSATMPSTGGLGTVPLSIGQIGFVGGYELTYTPAVLPLKSPDECLKMVMVLVKVIAWNFKTISLHDHIGPIPVPGPTYALRTYLGSVYEKFRINDNDGSLALVHEGPSTNP